MLSAVIPSEHSYSAVLLAEQPIDQRFVHPDPLVQRTTPLKYLAPAVDRRPTCLTHVYHILLCALDYIIIPIQFADANFHWEVNV